MTRGLPHGRGCGRPARSRARAPRDSLSNGLSLEKLSTQKFPKPAVPLLRCTPAEKKMAIPLHHRGSDRDRRDGAIVPFVPTVHPGGGSHV